MDSIHIIVADLSQLVRLGLVGLLHQTRFRITIREIATPEKLVQAISREQARVLIISRTFLNSCDRLRINSIKSKFPSATRILVIDTDQSLYPEVDFAEVIERHDNEKSMLKKLEKQLFGQLKNGAENVPPDDISDRERDVLRLVAQGLTNKEIADRLFISSHTVITHRKNITAKLGIRTIAGLTMYALMNRLIIPEETKP
jgi:DNA-binding NarL/FixJ family response regulator